MNHERWIGQSRKRERKKKARNILFEFMQFFIVVVISYFCCCGCFFRTIRHCHSISFWIVLQRLFTASQWHSRSWIKEIVLLQVLLTSRSPSSPSFLSKFSFFQRNFAPWIMFLVQCSVATYNVPIHLWRAYVNQTKEQNRQDEKP